MPIRTSAPTPGRCSAGCECTSLVRRPRDSFPPTFPDTLTPDRSRGAFFAELAGSRIPCPRDRRRHSKVVAARNFPSRFQEAWLNGTRSNLFGRNTGRSTASAAPGRVIDFFRWSKNGSLACRRLCASAESMQPIQRQARTCPVRALAPSGDCNPDLSRSESGEVPPWLGQWLAYM